jgi:hypothetical protein
MPKNVKIQKTISMLVAVCILISVVLGTWFVYNKINSEPEDKNLTRLYVITLDIYREHKVMKTNFVFLYVTDIYKVMKIFKEDQGGKYITQEIFRDLIEDFAVYEIKNKRYKVKLLNKVGWYDIYELVDHGIYDVYEVHKRY